MALPADFQNVKQNQIVDDGCLLFIPSKSVSKQNFLLMLKFVNFVSLVQDVNNASFKRVAVVEYFFSIIYKVHCSVGEGEGRHVGQKRTYRKVSSRDIFLDRVKFEMFSTVFEKFAMLYDV